MTRKAIAQFTESKTGLAWKLSVRAAKKSDDYTDDPDELEDPLEERKEDAEEAGETGSDDSANGPDDSDDDDEENGDDDLEIVDMMVYGDIGTGGDLFGEDENGVSAAQFRRALATVPNAKRINLHINSSGGNIYDALAIKNVLEAHSAEKVSYVDGLAASAAAVLACVGKTIMRQNSFMYIHNSWAAAVGDKSTMNKAAEQLEKADSTIADIFAGKTDLGKKDILQMMEDTTWMTAREAKAKGFADEVRGKTTKAKKSSDANAYVFNGVTFNLDPKRYKNIPANLARLKISKPAAAARNLVSAPAVNTKEENPMNIDELKSKCPDLYQEVYNLGLNSERERIAKLDRLIYPATASIVAEAKAQGKTAGDIMESVVAALANAKPEPEPKEQPPPKISVSRARDAVAVNSLGADISPEHKVELTDMERRAEAADLIANSFSGRNGALAKKTLK